MSNCEYVKETYGVPSEIGRRVIVNGEPGIIAEDRGNYIGVNFDSDKPTLTRSQQRYQEYLNSAWYDAGDSFKTYLGIG